MAFRGSNQAEEEEEEEEDYHVKYTGLGGMLKRVIENRTSLEKEIPADRATKLNLPLELLCDVGAGQPKSLRSQRVSSFYCDICHLDLNSKVTYDTHVMGTKHQKKARNQQQLGQALTSVGLELPKTGPIPKVVSKTVKNINIRELVREATDPIIGLQYISEIFPESNENGEFEAMFSCEMCSVQSAVATIFSHILGVKHKEKYLFEKYNLKNLSKQELVREAQIVEKAEGRNIEDIKTVFSDELYPWPPGKKPITKSASMIPPLSVNLPARPTGQKRPIEKVENDYVEPDASFKRQRYDFAQLADKQSLQTSQVAKVLIALRKCAVKNEDDAEMAHAVAAHLVRALADYKYYTGNFNDVLNLREDSELILHHLQRIKAIHSIPLEENASPLQNQPSTIQTGWKADVVDYGHGRRANKPSEPAARPLFSRDSEILELGKFHEGSADADRLGLMRVSGVDRTSADGDGFNRGLTQADSGMDFGKKDASEEVGYFTTSDASLLYTRSSRGPGIVGPLPGHQEDQVSGGLGNRTRGTGMDDAEEGGKKNTTGSGVFAGSNLDSGTRGSGLHGGFKASSLGNEANSRADSANILVSNYKDFGVGRRGVDSSGVVKALSVRARDFSSNNSAATFVSGASNHGDVSSGDGESSVGISGFASGGTQSTGDFGTVGALSNKGSLSARGSFRGSGSFGGSGSVGEAGKSFGDSGSSNGTGSFGRGSFNSTGNFRGSGSIGGAGSFGRGSPGNTGSFGRGAFARGLSRPFGRARGSFGAFS